MKNHVRNRDEHYRAWNLLGIGVGLLGLVLVLMSHAHAQDIVDYGPVQDEQIAKLKAAQKEATKKWLQAQEQLSQAISEKNKQVSRNFLESIRETVRLKDEKAELDRIGNEYFSVRAGGETVISASTLKANLIRLNSINKDLAALSEEFHNIYSAQNGEDAEKEFESLQKMAAKYKNFRDNISQSQLQLKFTYSESPTAESQNVTGRIVLNDKDSLNYLEILVTFSNQAKLEKGKVSVTSKITSIQAFEGVYMNLVDEIYPTSY